MKLRSGREFCHHNCDLWTTCCECADKRVYYEPYLAFNKPSVVNYSIVARSHYYCPSCKNRIHENGFLQSKPVIAEQITTTDKMDVASKIILTKDLPDPSEFVNIADCADPRYEWEYYNSYFYFKSELTLNDEERKKFIRHLTIYKDRFYDYIAKKEYKSLSEWATDNGKTLDDILYGINRDYPHGFRLTAYVSLNKLVIFMDNTYTGEPVVSDEPVVEVKKGLTVFEFDTLLSQLDDIRKTVETMKMQID